MAFPSNPSIGDTHTEFDTEYTYGTQGWYRTKIGRDNDTTYFGLRPIEMEVPSRTPTTTRVASSASSVTILAANANRKGFSISNISTSKLYLSFTNPATTANCFIEVPAGAFLLLDQQCIVPNAIYGIWASANGAAQVTEYV
jgi:hypothetical protein